MIPRAAILLALLLSGCSAQLLDFADEPLPPGLCSEQTQLFDSFSMQVTHVEWVGAKDRQPSLLNLEVGIRNQKAWPAALSNSGGGVLYDVRFALHGKQGTFDTKYAGGIFLSREPRKFKEPPRRAIFGPPPPKQKREAADSARDVNFRIDPGATEEGTLSFEVPRGTYLLIAERNFPEGRDAKQFGSRISACRITG